MSIKKTVIQDKVILNPGDKAIVRDNGEDIDSLYHMVPSMKKYIGEIVTIERKASSELEWYTIKNDHGTWNWHISMLERYIDEEVLRELLLGEYENTLKGLKE